MKQCTKCKEKKELSEFWIRKERKSGYQTICKDCCSKRKKQCIEKKPEHYWEIRRKWYQRNKEKCIKTQKAYNEKVVEKDKLKFVARRRLNDHLKLGNIEKKDYCEICGITQEKTEAHHSDYSKPFEVVWVCKKCHIMVHKSLNRRKKENGTSN